MTAEEQGCTNEQVPCILPALETLSTAHIDLYLHEIEWIISQLEEVARGEEGKMQPYQAEMYESFKYVEELVFATRNALIFERARRAILNLQAIILDGLQERDKGAMHMITPLYRMADDTSEKEKG